MAAALLGALGTLLGALPGLPALPALPNLLALLGLPALPPLPGLNPLVNPVPLLLGNLPILTTGPGPVIVAGMWSLKLIAIIAYIKIAEGLKKGKSAVEEPEPHYPPPEPAYQPYHGHEYEPPEPGYGHGAPVHGHGAPDHGHGAPGHGHGAPDHGHEAPGHGHGVPDHGHGAPGHGHGAPDHGHGVPDHGHGAPDHGHGAPDHGHGAPDHGHGAPNQGHGTTDHGHGAPEHNALESSYSSLDHPARKRRDAVAMFVQGEMETYRREEQEENVDEEEKQLEGLVWDTATLLDTSGCVLKMLCHLQQINENERTVEEQLLVYLFAHQPIKQSLNGLPNQKKMDATAEKTCQQSFPQCNEDGEQLRVLLGHLWGSPVSAAGKQ